MREILDLFLQIVGFEANGSGNSLGVRVVISMASDVGDNDVLTLVRCKTTRQFFHGHAGNHIKQAVLAVNPDAIGDVRGQPDAQDNLRGGTRRAYSARDGTQE